MKINFENYRLPAVYGEFRQGKCFRISEAANIIIGYGTHAVYTDADELIELAEAAKKFRNRRDTIIKEKIQHGI